MYELLPVGFRLPLRHDLPAIATVSEQRRFSVAAP
jgi:hypothetical protein